MHPVKLKPFYLITDLSSGDAGIAGEIGIDDPQINAKIIAEGAVLANCRAVLIWLSPSCVHGGHSSIAGIDKIHGQNGKRKIVFINDEMPTRRQNIPTFSLERREDVTGLSGTGKVAEGMQFSNGWCILNWLVEPFSDFWYPSYRDIEIIHGHEGKTSLIWHAPPKTLEPKNKA